MSCYNLAEEVIALLGTVSAEALRPAHFISGRVQSLHHRLSEREGDVAYAEAYHRPFGLSLLERRNTFSYLAEEVAFL